MDSQTLFEIWDAIAAKSICPVWYSADGADAHCIVKQNGMCYQYTLWGWEKRISREVWCEG